MNIEVILKPCPWCHETPDIHMPVPDKDTWCWEIRCNNSNCKMRPKSPYIAIRNTSKTDFSRFFGKLCELAFKWNHGNWMTIKEMKLIDISPIEKNFTLNRIPYIDPGMTRINAVN